MATIPRQRMIKKIHKKQTHGKKTKRATSCYVVKQDADIIARLIESPKQATRKFIDAIQKYPSVPEI